MDCTTDFHFPLATPDSQDAIRHIDLLGTLHDTWDLLCATYDASIPLPELRVLLDGADLHHPGQTAEVVMINMLTEVIESIGRFSPWYKEPALSFGLVTVLDARGHTRWALSPAALHRWYGPLDDLGLAIEKNLALLQAAQLLDDLEDATQRKCTHVIARCACEPPSTIFITKVLHQEQEIICAVCEHRFKIIDN
jgi:hypothetical protein